MPELGKFTTSSTELKIGLTKSDREILAEIDRTAIHNSSLVPPEHCARAMELLDIERPEILATPSQGVGLAKRLILSFPVRDLADAAHYVETVAAQFEDYTFAVGEAVCDPRRGLASRVKFMPAASEVHEALEAERQRIRDLYHKAKYFLDQHRRRTQEHATLAEPMVGPERVAELLAGIFKQNVVAPDPEA